MPEEPNGNGSATHDVTAVAAPPPPPFLEDDDDLSEDLLDPVEDSDDETPAAEPFIPDMSVPEAEFDFDDLDDDDDDVPVAPAAPTAPAEDDRIAKLEAAARELAAADVDRHERRVRRKVSAATTGAGATGFIPILLSLVGVYDLDPATTAALSTLASLLGAFVVGYFTPERRPSLDPEIAHRIQALGQ
jgi:hypothetical protein